MITEKSICNVIKTQRRCAKAYCQENVKHFYLSDGFDVEYKNPVYARTSIMFNEKTGNVAISCSIQCDHLVIGEGGRNKRNIKDPGTIERITKWYERGQEARRKVCV